MLKPGLPSPDHEWSRRQEPLEKPCCATESVKRESTGVVGGQAGQQRRCHGDVTEQKQELVVRVVLVTVGGIGTTEKHQSVQCAAACVADACPSFAVAPLLAVRCGARGGGPRLRRSRAACCGPLHSSTRQGRRRRSRSGGKRRPTDQAGPR